MCQELSVALIEPWRSHPLTVSHKEIIWQCDQMTRLFPQYLSNYNNDSLPTSIKIAKVGLEFCQILNNAAKTCQRLLKFCRSGKTLQNLVTV